MHNPPNLVHAVAHLLVSSVSVFIVAHLLPGIHVKSFASALAFALVVALLNAVAWTFLGPLTLPIKWLTLGVGAVIFNGIIFLIAGRIVAGVRISGCVIAAIAALGVSLVNHFIQGVLSKL